MPIMSQIGECSTCRIGACGNPMTTEENEKDETTVFRNTFVFDEETFQEYYCLHLRPHDKGTGRACIGSGLAMLFFIGFMLFLLSLGSPSLPKTLDPTFWSKSEMAGLEMLLVLSFLAVVYGPILGYGVYLLSRPRIPRWGNAEWRSKTERCFRSLKQGPTNSPTALGVEFFKNPLYPFIALQVASYSWGEKPRFFRFYPWMSFKHPEELLDPEHSCAPYEVSFEARFFEDRIEKGSQAEVFCDSYNKVYDIVEDKRFPHLAIIRSVDRGELVVRKDAFEGASWKKVKRFIERRKDESKFRLFRRKKR